MCQILEGWSLILALLCAVMFGIHGVLQLRFFKAFERSAPLVWKTFANTRNWMDWSDSSGTAAAQWYLLKGDFTNITDASLVARAKRSRLATLAFLVLLGVWGLFVWATQALPRLACIPGLGS